MMNLRATNPPDVGALSARISAWIFARLSKHPPEGLRTHDVVQLQAQYKKDIEFLVREAVLAHIGIGQDVNDALFSGVQALALATPTTDGEGRAVEWAQKVLNTPPSLWDAHTRFFAWNVIQAHADIIKPHLGYEPSQIKKPPEPSYFTTKDGLHYPRVIDWDEEENAFVVYPGNPKYELIKRLGRILQSGKFYGMPTYSHRHDGYIVDARNAPELLRFKIYRGFSATKAAQAKLDEHDNSDMSLMFYDRSGNTYETPTGVNIWYPSHQVLFDKYKALRDNHKLQGLLLFSENHRDNKGGRYHRIWLKPQAIKSPQTRLKAYQMIVDLAHSIGVRNEAVEELRQYLVEAHEEVQAKRQEEAKREREKKEKIALSHAQDADLPPDFLKRLGMELFPFQRAGVRYAADQKRTFIADEQGLGKTAQALATLLYLDAFPALVVVPATLKLDWAAKTAMWLKEKRGSISVLGMKRPFRLELDGQEVIIHPDDVSHDVLIINYDILKAWEERLSGLELKAIVLDESHRIKNASAKRTSAALFLKDGVDVRLALSGTPYMSRPAELTTQLQFLGTLDESFGSKDVFKKIYNFEAGAVFDRPVGDQQERQVLSQGAQDALAGLNERLRGCCFVRREKREVLKDLPAKRRVSLCVNITNRSDYEVAELEFGTWLWGEFSGRLESLQRIVDSGSKPVGASRGDREDLVLLESIEGKPNAEKKLLIEEYIITRIARTLRMQATAQMNKLKLVSARGKLSFAFDWIANFLASGEKLIVFAHHREIVEAIAKKFGAPTIYGKTTQMQRYERTYRFQTDPETRLLVLNIASGREGLTLTAASNVLFLELGWTPAEHDQAEDRVHRIGQTADEVNAWYLLGNSTIDLLIADFIERKRDVVRAGISAAGGEPVAGRISACAGEGAEVSDMSDLLRRYIKKEGFPS